MQQAGRDINQAVSELYEVYGPVFSFGVGPVRFIWFVGPEANKFVLEDAAEHFQLGPAYGFLRTIGGDTALITSDEPEHLRRRRLVQPAFHRSRLASLDVLLQTRLTELFESWAGRSVDLYKEVQGRVLEVICEVLLGRAALTTPLTADIARMMRYANLPFQLQLVKLRVPGSPWAKFLAARHRADAALYREIARRRTSGDLGDDVLGLLLAARDETGQGLSDVEMRDQAISLVSAGFDTTSAALTWAVYELYRQPELLAELRTETFSGRRAAVTRADHQGDVAPLSTGTGWVAADNQGFDLRRVSPAQRSPGGVFDLRVAPAELELPGTAAVLPTTLGELYAAALQLSTFW